LRAIKRVSQEDPPAGTGDLGGQRIERADLMSQAGRQLAQGRDGNPAAFIRRALAATVGLAAIANGAWRFHPSRPFRP
jgi:hypothetical protein